MTVCAQVSAEVATYDNAYSRLVAWLKIILPLVALGLLSLLFLLARPTDPEGTVPYADVDVDKIIRDQRILAPRFAGVTDDGSAIQIAATQARPLPEDTRKLEATGLEARIDLATGPIVTLESGRGLIDGENKEARFEGRVLIETSEGMEISTEALTSALSRLDLVTDGPVTAKAPLGELEAGMMRLSTGEDGSHLLVFQDGVRLIYKP